MSHKYNFIVCVSMTSPCSFNCSTTFFVQLAKREANYGNGVFGNHGPSPPWLRPWCYGSGIVLDNDCKVFSFLIALEEFFV